MGKFEVGDRVILNEGDFKGDRGTITDKDLIGDEIKVALEEDGREIDTHEAHVSLLERED